METLESTHRTQLESGVLSALCIHPNWFGLFDLSVADFRDRVTRKIFKFITKLNEKNEEISLVAFANDFDISEIKFLFDTEFGPFATPKDFSVACEKLREDTIRCEIIKKTKECGDSVEYMNFIETVKQLNTIGTLESFEEQLKKYAEEYEEIDRRNKAGQSSGLMLTWKTFTEAASLFPGDYCVLGARTSIGKTSFALSLAIDAAFMGQSVLFLSSEMPRKHVFDKMAACLMQQPVWKFKYAKAPLDETINALRSLKDKISFVYMPTMATHHIRAMLRKAPRFDLVIVDYLQLLKDYPRKSDTENLRLGRISAALKAIAGEFETVMFVPAQLNRESEKQKRRPMLSDLRDSGCIEQDADVVLLLHRENREEVEADLIIAKNRTGQTGEIQFLFNPEWSYFREAPDAKLT
ncbi:MAG: Replicative DNA helicase [Pelotomaculum sp. PtaB.Bin104]|nr:MAG: Replicative DNA helicase [Pelotomaculum sp. PtaB.Bin104]